MIDMIFSQGDSILAVQRRGKPPLNLQPELLLSIS